MKFVYSYSNKTELGLGSRVGLVPTMGALHDGHLSLVKKIRSHVDSVVLSIFINPLQFNSKSDLEKYPRTLAADQQMAESAGVDLLWVPTESEIYQADTPVIEPPSVGYSYEGLYRPKHFRGVLTVVNRLFNIVQPQVAIFGEKDFQQLFLIENMVKKLNLPISILAGETMRDSSGLALSSRNSQLHDQKKVSIFSDLISDLNHSDLDVSSRLKYARERLSKIFTLEYCELIDSLTFQPIGQNFKGDARLIFAGYAQGVRLIDNGLVRFQ